MTILKFYCKLCNDEIARTRAGIRKHLGENHLRNEYFGSEDMKNKKQTKLSRVRIEEWK